MLELALEHGWVTEADIEAVGGAAPIPQPAPAPAAPEPVAETPMTSLPTAMAAPLTTPSPEPAIEPPSIEIVAAPTVSAAADITPAQTVQRFQVAIHLAGGERLEVGTGVDEEAAKTLGREIVSQVSSSPDGGWPFFAGRFLRPDTIVSIDIVEQDS